jgi:hypothetical protein
LRVDGVGVARKELEHPVQRRVNDLCNYSRGVRGGALLSSLGDEQPTLRLEVNELDETSRDDTDAALPPRRVRGQHDRR